MKKQSGFSVLSFLLVGVGIFSGLIYFLANSGMNIQGQVNSLRSSQLVAQAQLIAHRVSKCALDYPDGDNGSGLHKPYPAGVSVDVSALVCPKTGQNLWSGVDGVYMPVIPEGFSSWLYTNSSSQIRISITAVHPTNYASSIAAAAGKLGGQASATADTFSLIILQ